MFKNCLVYLCSKFFLNKQVYEDFCNGIIFNVLINTLLLPKKYWIIYIEKSLV